MSVLPPNLNDQIIFCETHAPIWSVSPTSIGLTAALCTTMTANTTKARGSYNAAQAAREASKAATISLHKDVTTMRDQVSTLIAQIKAFADQQSNPDAVYALAQIPMPAAPTPLPAPGKPSNFSVALNGDGSITLSWDSTDSTASTGAFFAVSRKLPGQGAFVGIGGAPGTTNEARRAAFTDATVPATAASQGAQYIVQGFRGTRVGEASDAVVVQFGVDGNGLANASLKMAA